MEHTVDDTAKAILKDGALTFTVIERDGETLMQIPNIADFEAMAKLWLMKQECMSALHFAIDIAPDGSTVKENATEWLAQIEAMEK